jgi:hypothetical protein
VKDPPEAWHAAMQADLGIVPSDDRNCCLQDVHWYSGYIGGRFQSYTIGNILSAQFYAAALKAHPDVPAEITSGRIRGRCAPGCATIFTGTAASSSQTISFSAQPAPKCTRSRISTIFARNTARFVGCLRMNRGESRW